jgi:hypothetical protein
VISADRITEARRQAAVEVQVDRDEQTGVDFGALLLQIERRADEILSEAWLCPRRPVILGRLE